MERLNERFGTRSAPFTWFCVEIKFCTMNTEAVASEEEIMDAYRRAVAHAEGDQFASMLQVSHAGGWFTVRDLQGTESRYRKKEIISLTRSLLKQPKFGAESRLDLAALVDVPRQVPPMPPRKSPAANQTQGTSAAPQQETAAIEGQGKSLSLANNSSASKQPSAIATGLDDPVEESDADGKITQFPLNAASSDLNRKQENKAYFRNLRRILLVVATIIGFVVLVLAFRRH